MIILFIINLMLITFSMTGSACEFYFNYQEVKAPLGTVGTIAVRVLKEHNDCELKGMDEYMFEWGNVQILQQTDWEEINNNLYQKQFQIILSEKGTGYFLISKDCTREGYDEKRIPVTILKGGEIWNTAYNEKFPYEDIDISLKSTEGNFTLKENTLIINDHNYIINDNHNYQLSAVLDTLKEYPEKIKIYYIQIENENHVILITSETFFYRFDQYYNF